MTSLRQHDNSTWSSVNSGFFQIYIRPEEQKNFVKLSSSESKV